MDTSKWFVKNLKGKERSGVLMKLEEDEHSRYKFEVWFEYTRQAMNDIREGTMLAVPNYATKKGEIHYSILEATSLKPIHYAIGEDPDGFPGFVMEAAKNAAQDWTGQDDEPTEDTTTIKCTAIPTNLELVEEKGHYTFGKEQNIPMLGAVVRILNTEPTEQVVNQALQSFESDKLFEGGTLIRDSKVTAYISLEDFLQVHFAIFGFTGAGKSNLLSNYTSHLSAKKQPIKIVLFDLMGEYTSLLIDLLNSESLEKAHIIALGENTFPGPVADFLNKVKDHPTVQKAAEYMNRVTLLPKALQTEKENFQIALENLLVRDRVKIFSEVDNLTIWYLFYDFRNNQKCPLMFGNRRSQRYKDQIKAIIKAVLDKCIRSPRDYKDRKNYKAIALNRTLATDILKALNEELEKEDYKELKDKGDFQGVIEQIQSAVPQLESISPASISMNEILTDLNDNDENAKSSLYIIQAHNPEDMRKFVARLGEEVYETRRRSGQIRPLVSFILDEADEFIPQQAQGTYEKSKSIAATLVRRGRKFGLGIGIATQRIRYLDTSIMGQPHTYLVSKLPRRSDREAVAEAFGVSEDMFRQTFKFSAGNWLLMSHDATGLKAIPVPIQTEDANQRLQQYLRTLAK